MLGGLTHAQPLNPTESAWELAEKIGADCYLLPVPVYADRPEQRDAFMSQRSVQDVVFRARRANIAVLSVGSFSNDSPIANYGFIKPSEFEELQAAGAVGDILCHFIDAEGRADRPRGQPPRLRLSAARNCPTSRTSSWSRAGARRSPSCAPRLPAPRSRC